MADKSSKPAEILIVDDVEANRQILHDQMTVLGYDTVMAENGLSALARMKNKAPDVVLLDVFMPDMNGCEVLEYMKSDSSLRDIPVIIISAADEVKDIAQCLENGADDYLVKPHNPTLLAARMKAVIEKSQWRNREKELVSRIEDYTLRLEDRVREQVAEISETQQSVIFAMSRLVESRDQETGRHVERIRDYSEMLAHELTGNEKHRIQIDHKFIEDLYAASPLHDIGKVGIPDDILLKPGALSPEERTVMNRHTAIGADTLRAVDKHHPGNSFIARGIEITENHHEKWDGSGYPNGIAGESIPLSARIVALADVYDALTTDRPYRKAVSHEETRDIIDAERGKHFDPVIVDAFLSIEQKFFEKSRELGQENQTN